MGAKTALQRLQEAARGMCGKSCAFFEEKGDDFLDFIVMGMEHGLTTTPGGEATL